MELSPFQTIEKCVHTARSMCEHRYGIAPSIVVRGHTQASFAHFSEVIEYILKELIKNAMGYVVILCFSLSFSLPVISKI